VRELLERLRTGYGTNETDNEVNALCRVELLALDDLGAARLTEWSVDVQASILSARYNARLGTIVTTNLTLAEIADRIDPRIASRLGEALNLRLDLSDYRARRAQ
jgi:DNA replication protein DnaC